MIDVDDVPTVHELTAAILRREAERREWAAKRNVTRRGRPIHVGTSRFTGTVERRDPATYQRQSVVLAVKCANPYCRQWMPKGSHDAGRCLICQTPIRSPN